jgi:stringent starvation protein B
MNAEMTSSKPYVVRALYEWIVDNHCTPYLTLNTAFPDVHMPQKYVRQDEITLNISQEAVRDLEVTNSELYFKTSFQGEPFEVYAPIAAVRAIFAHENGMGMVFPEEKPSKGGKAKKKQKSHLQLVD